jgi:UDP:flavonoid glycosyltransferase YjiC (YdhE family)
VTDNGAPPLPDLEFIHESEHLNLYVYPEAADYARSRPLSPTWHRLDSSVRETEEPGRSRRAPLAPGALVYLSLGSLGSADVDLMKRLVSVLAETPHRYIVSKGLARSRVRSAGQHVGRRSALRRRRSSPRATW